jgi:hypothetical protein
MASTSTVGQAPDPPAAASLPARLARRMRRWRWQVIHQWHRRFDPDYWDNWPSRIARVCRCPDNSFIPRVPGAGRVEGNQQVMHNGLRIVLGSYYGAEMSRLIERNRGVHEPQEERLFAETLKLIPPGGTMVELGAYWGFYSLWFCRDVPHGRAWLVEPEAAHLDCGRRNFELNSLTAHFIRARVGVVSAPAIGEGPRQVCVDDLLTEQELDEVAILHADLQRHELEMLQGARKSVKADRIGYFFISTHTEELHQACVHFLHEHGCYVEASIRPRDSYSFDGILVGRSPRVPPLPELRISLRSRAG